MNLDLTLKNWRWWLRFPLFLPLFLCLMVQQSLLLLARGIKWLAYKFELLQPVTQRMADFVKNVKPVPQPVFDPASLDDI